MKEYTKGLRIKKISKIFQNTFYALSSKLTKQKLLLVGLITLVLIGTFLWWDNRQYNQCKSLLSAKISFSGAVPKQYEDRIMYCVKLVYGIDTTSKPAPSFGKLLEDIKALFPFLNNQQNQISNPYDKYKQ